MLIYDTITTSFEGNNIFDLSAPCECAHYKVYKNAWIVEELNLHNLLCYG